MPQDVLQDILVRRGFLCPSYEVYGGVSGFYDYAPLGGMLKRNIENLWRRFFVVEEGFFEVDTPTIAPEQVFVASGHVENFADPVVSCRKCGTTYRADHFLQEKLGAENLSPEPEVLQRLIEERGVRCNCGGELGEVRRSSLMFSTTIGAGGRRGYLRPETAQGMFVMFPRLYSFYRKKLPFGVVQIGRAYRNEISPRQGLLRLREFTQAEAEIFVDPEEKRVHPGFGRYAGERLRLVPRSGEVLELSAKEAVERGVLPHEFLAYYMAHTRRFLMEVGIPGERIRFRQHLKDEMAHYAEDCWDAEVLTKRYGWVEVVGIADRTDYDLRAHESLSGVEMRAFRQFREAVTKRVMRLVPNMQVLGPEFRGLAPRIAEAVEKLPEEAAEEFERTGRLEVHVEGEKVVLGERHLRVEQVELRQTGEKFTPHVIEPSFGIDRILYAVLECALAEREGKRVLRLRPQVAPVKAAVFPLVSREELEEVALEIFREIKSQGMPAVYDASDSIGRRYARVDEIGVPFAVTVDFESLENGTVTLRHRDTAEQVRVGAKEVPGLIRRLCEGMSWDELREKLAAAP